MIKRGIIYFFLITVCLYLLRYLHYQGLKQQTKGYYGKLNQAFDSVNHFNVLFLGSSRSEMHYDTRVFDSITGMNSFNLGLPGATPGMALAVLRTYLEKSKTPKYLIYETDFHVMKLSPFVISEFNNYFPYLNNAVLRTEFGKIDPRTFWFYAIPYYSLPFTGLKNLSTGLHGWAGIPNKTDNLYHKGFFAENSDTHLQYLPSNPANLNIHPAAMAQADSLFNLCKRKNIKLCLVTSPLFGGGRTDILNLNSLTKQVQYLATKHRMAYINLISMPLCSQRMHFIDHQHMKLSGARIFTQRLASVFNNKIR